MPERIIKYSEALAEGTRQSMEKDSSVFIMGLGVPSGMGGTTAGLKEAFPDRVFDSPTSEAALTGMAVGAAINGLRPIVHHDRVEFSLLAADQMFTQAAKWNYMFGGGNPVPLTLRIVVGRQWGNGPQHSQAFYSTFGNVLGLKVVIPSTPYMAKGLLAAAVEDNNPTVILEPRWLYGTKQEVPAEHYTLPLDKARVVAMGDTVTVVAYGDGLVDAISARELVGVEAGIELIDLVSLNPIDYETIFASVAKTGRLICIDTTHSAFSVGSEIIAKVAQNPNLQLKNRPMSLACPDVPCPTSPALSEFYYPNKIDIANIILRMFNKPELTIKLSFEELHMAPGHTIVVEPSPVPSNILQTLPIEKNE